VGPSPNLAEISEETARAGRAVSAPRRHHRLPVVLTSRNRLTSSAL
jgi:hypothetical protein